MHYYLLESLYQIVKLNDKKCIQVKLYLLVILSLLFNKYYSDINIIQYNFHITVIEGTRIMTTI